MIFLEIRKLIDMLENLTEEYIKEHQKELDKIFETSTVRFCD